MPKRVVRTIVISTTVVALIAVYAVFNPALTGWFPKCPFRMATGLECPGCGSQRAAHNLLNFNIRGALAENVLVVAAIPYVVAGFIFGISHPANETALKWRKRLFGPIAVHVVLVVVILFWILRNIPYLRDFL